MAIKAKTSLLQLITGLNVGGAEMLVHDLALFASKDIFHVHVMAMIDRNELLPRFQENGLSPVILGMNKGKPLSFPLGIVQALRFVRRKQIEVIHAHMTHALLLACVIKLFVPRVKIIFTSHNINIGSKLRENLVFLLRPFRKTDIVFSDLMLNSSYLKPDHTVIVPNAIHTERFSIVGEKDPIFTFIYVARFEYQKNHRFLIGMVKQLMQDNLPDFKIICVGKGSLFEDMAEAIKQEELEDKICLLGLRSDIPELLARSHAFIMPSLWEGFPISILEAGAAGLAVIATPVGSIPKIVDETTGYIVELDHFTAAVKWVLQHQQEALLKGVRFKKEVAEKYDISSIVKQHEQIYLS